MKKLWQRFKVKPRNFDFSVMIPERRDFHSFAWNQPGVQIERTLKHSLSFQKSLVLGVLFNGGEADCKIDEI